MHVREIQMFAEDRQYTRPINWNRALPVPESFVPSGGEDQCPVKVDLNVHRNVRINFRHRHHRGPAISCS
jgi:hypothetical protein